ncbi:MAG TPA: radical SAM/SPASM domain-containing protein [Thermoanaerobaculia bacterium]|nr:radical SAM/SPASM domain-containing protein [Thermoanaerobaculia bacterium]
MREITDQTLTALMNGLAGREQPARPGRPRLRINPFLHLGPDRVYNPLTDRLLQAGEPGYDSLRQTLGGMDVTGLAAADRDLLAEAGWLQSDDVEPGREHLLKYVSLEAHTVCNQSCYFCPVSIAPREDYFMPTELYERIVGELGAYRDTLEAVFMINYNEPTADRRFVDQVRAIRGAGLPPAVLTNGTGLTPDRVDALVEMGGLRFLSINISTLDRERYQRDRGKDQLPIVLRHLDYAKDKPLAEQMDMVVLGTGNDDHKRDFEEITRRFEGSRFTVKYFEVMDRAGYLQIGMKPATPHQRLCGCDNVGSRPLQHLHITPQAKCVLCCEDYDEKYVVGDLTRQSVEEVLTGPALALMRRWAYGLEEAPADFMCRGCTFALTRPA